MSASCGDGSGRSSAEVSSSSLTLPRIVLVQPHAAPYAQLCFRRIGDTPSVVAMMIGKQSNDASCSPPQGEVIVEDDHEMLDLGRVYTNQSNAEALEDSSSEHWASWGSLRSTLSFSPSTTDTTVCSAGSFRFCPNIRLDNDTDANPDSRLDATWLDEHWLRTDGESLMDGDTWLLGDESGDDPARSGGNDASLMAALRESTACGKLMRNFAPGKSRARRRDRMRQKKNKKNRRLLSLPPLLTTTRSSNKPLAFGYAVLS